MALLSLFLVTWAQKPLVTLSHDGELSFFSTQSAFQDALDAAQDGDIIYLSEGKFSTIANEITLTKRLSIVGCGYNSHILTNIIIDVTGNANAYMDAPLFDGVRLSNLTFYDRTGNRDALKEVEITRCWIRELTNGGCAGNNFTIDKCYVETANFNTADANNTVVMNSKIKEITPVSGCGHITVINCNVGMMHYCPKSMFNSIVKNVNGRLAPWGNGTSKYYIYNSLAPSSSYFEDERIVTYECYYDDSQELLDDNLECPLDLKANEYLSNDDLTVVGIYGGGNEFSENPSLPTVDSSKSSVEYDADSNKLKVTITVKPN